MSNPEPIFLGVKEAGAYLGLARTSIYILINARKLQAVKIGRRTLLRVESLQAFADSLPDYDPPEP